MTGIFIYLTNTAHERVSRYLVGVATTAKNRDALVRALIRNSAHAELAERRINTRYITHLVDEVRKTGKTTSLSTDWQFGIETEAFALNALHLKNKI